MIPKECKRLAEVDFPIAVVSKHSLAEKARRFGTPHQLHLWWAWRPLAACRSMLLALLLPDPCDKHCPADFKKQARTLLAKLRGHIDADDMGLREALLGFIGDFAAWELSSNRTYLEVSRNLIHAAHPEEMPLVVDPFAGSGSIPLEALRIGCDASASDLNPVACLINKVILEDIPRHGAKVAEDLRRVGEEVNAAATTELSEFYPVDPDGARPIAYLWARTVRCEAPNCGAEIPLVRSFWLSKKGGRRRALRYSVIRHRGSAPDLKFEICEPSQDSDVPSATVSRAKATCPCCSSASQQTVLPAERVRAQLASQRGGADVVFDRKGCRTGGALLLAVVMLRSDKAGRHYRLPTDSDYRAVWKAQSRLSEVANQRLPNGLSPVPDEPTPRGGGSGAGRAFSVQKYGMTRFADLFTSRQLVSLTTISRLATRPITMDVRELLGLAVSKLAERNNAFCDWMVGVECPGHLYTQQVIPTSWDFAEGVPICESSGSFGLSVSSTADNADSCYTGITRTAGVSLCDATNLALPDEAAGVFFTDPPYYDAVPYSDLSDFFFVWLKRILTPHRLMHDPFDSANPLTPKIPEAVQDETRMSEGKPKDRLFFEQAMERSFAHGRRVLRDSGIGCIVFAHKTTEGWEALLSGLVKGRWVITGSWPITTERSARMRARDSAALATSVHLVCRPREEDAGVGDWAYVLRECPRRVGEWMERLQSEGVRGADLVFACIGPALEVFSRYSRVETADGREVKLAEYLEKVWEVVGRAALEQVLGTAEAKARNGAAGALEEDARLTALFLWTLQSTEAANGNGKTADGEDADEGDDDDAPTSKKDGFSLIFDVVRRFAQPLGIQLPKWEDRIIKIEKGIVRLLPVAERAGQLFGESSAQAVAAWLEEDPAKDIQPLLFQEMQDAQPVKAKSRGRGKKPIMEASDLDIQNQMQATTLDRVHAAMLLQAGGQSNALRSLIQGEQQRGPDFLRLANALSALYPRVSEEKRLLDAMLLAVPR